MSLETAIQENTNALRDLMALISANLEHAQRPITVEPQEIPAQLRKAKPTPKPPAVPSSEPTPTASESSESSSTESSAAEESEATLDDAKKALRALYDAKGRDATVDALSRFGAAKVIDLLPEHYGPFVTLVNEVLAGERV